ncbi:hypothetical protein E8A45_08950 [Salmonella enterica]|nr:hypothetical protein [Salmonella enterica]EBW1593245.1 hypothetical protein [Salmonella enterica subsp. diarizonae serovar 61:r:z]EDR7606933.1 hypothetical protein [Salmonella enterica subsp. diarizonae]EAT8024291.1 hypothetical protein [Salmonella enterica]EBB6123555.1 hypothetical protein [Salmonella enterica]
MRVFLIFYHVKKTKKIRNSIKKKCGLKLIHGMLCSLFLVYVQQLLAMHYQNKNMKSIISDSIPKLVNISTLHFIDLMMRVINKLTRNNTGDTGITEPVHKFVVRQQVSSHFLLHTG